MFRRLMMILVSSVLLLAVEPAPAQQAGPKPISFSLAYRKVFEGLKAALPPTSKRRPKIGLALAGGGAKAAASIGVLKVLHEEGVPVSAVAGTSMGALVGGLFAAGYSPDEIEKIFLENDWNDLFSDTPGRAFLTQEQKEAGSRHLLQFSFLGGRLIPPSGLTAGQKLANLLTAKTLAASFQAGLDFNNLAVTFRAVATDIETGAPVVLDHGLLHEALRASSAIPIMFQPVEIQGRLLIDGGISNNLPVDVVRSMGADLVIAVDPSAKLAKKEHLLSLIEIMGQAISLPVRRETENQAARADAVITPDTGTYSFADFHRMREIIRIGEATARAALPHIQAVMRRLRAGMQSTIERFHITSLAVNGNESTPENTIRYAFAAALSPRETTADDILEALAEVYQLGFFSDISLDLYKQGETYHAVLTVAENPVVTAIRISGNSMVSSAELMNELDFQLGKPLNSTSVIGSLDRVARRYRDRGYLLVHVDYAGMDRDGTTLSIVLSEGRVDGVRLIGQKRTRPSLINREIRTTTGKPLNFSVLEDDIQHLYGLNIFESLNLDIRDSGRGGVLLTFKIKERPRGTVRLGLRYDLEDSFTGLTDVVVNNLAGRGIKLFLNTRYGNYTDLALGYYSPVLVNTYFVHSLQAFYRDRTYFIYTDKKRTGALEVSRTGADFAFGYQWFRFGDTYIRYRYESDRTTEVFGVSSTGNPAHIGSLAFLSTIDTRDSHTFPHSGILFKGSYETASHGYGGNIDFRKTSLYGQGSFPIGERHAVLIDLSAGFGSGALPYQEQFGIGGADYLLGFPLPGYRRREFVGANELGAALAYRWKIADYQLKAIKAVYLNLSGGAANVWASRDDMSAEDLRKGGGIGLHADTLVGPFRLDFGAGEDNRYVMYFSAGFDF